MSGTVRSITIEYRPVNGNNIFTNGDVVSGHVVVVLGKQCHINQLFVKFKGKAMVHWSERRAYYEAKEKYFSIKHFFLIQDQQTLKQGADFQILRNEYGRPYGNMLGPGRHLYPFTFQFPDRGVPASFKNEVLTTGADIVYSLEAALSRPMRMDSKASSILTFVPKTVSLPPLYAAMNIDLQAPQHRYKEKTTSVFSSAKVVMDGKIDKMGYCQGEGIQVETSIQNNSSLSLRLKYCLYKKLSFYAEGERKVHTKDLLKEVGNLIPAKFHQTVTKVITIPPDMEPSIFNCTCIRREYRLRVYLDVKLAFDPKIKFDIVVLPVSGDAPGTLAVDPYLFSLPAARTPTPARTPDMEQGPFVMSAARFPTGTPTGEQRPFVLSGAGSPTGTPTVEQCPFSLPATWTPTPTGTHAVEPRPAYSGFGGEELLRSPGQSPWSIVGSYGTHSSLSDF